MDAASRARIVVGNSSLVGYPEAGGHWACLLQHLLGLDALGHDVLWLELFRSTADRARDDRLISTFFLRMQRYGVAERCVVLEHDGTGPPMLSRARPHGRDAEALRRFIRSADAVWNMAGALSRPLLEDFRRRALVDVDPGHFQVSALDFDLGVSDHETLFTVGGKVHQPDCEIPTLGRRWLPFAPVVHLPFYEAAPPPGPQAPFTSVTQWNWEELLVGERMLSISKRNAYVRFLSLPKRTGRRFELAANIDVDDVVGDRPRLEGSGWAVVDPHVVVGSPARFVDYIRRSRAEICCAKGIFRDLRTGWFSDRSAAYMASGRPVLAEDTGFSDWLPAGEGVVAFTDEGTAVSGCLEIDSHYAAHARAARELAEAFFDARKVLPPMVQASTRS